MLNELRYDGASRMAGVGDYFQNRAQADRDNQIANYTGNQTAPWEQLARYASVVNGQAPFFGTQQKTVPNQRGSTAQRLIGGATAGAGMGSMFGPWGTGLGAIGGGLMGLWG
jgi:hypothetical protein